MAREWKIKILVLVHFLLHFFFFQATVYVFVLCVLWTVAWKKKLEKMCVARLWVLRTGAQRHRSRDHNMATPFLFLCHSPGLTKRHRAAAAECWSW